VPVVVTGPTGGVGRFLVPILAERGEVRAVVRRRSGATEGLRSAGAKVAVCDLADTSTLATVMGDAHTVVHLAGGLDLPDESAYEAVNHGTVADALEAAEQASIRRFIFLSYPGASSSAENPYLRAKGRAEDAVRASRLEHVILRCTHVYGPSQRWLTEMRAAAERPIAAVVVGPGDQRLAPVFVGDVAAAILAADDRAASVEGTSGLQGPEVLTADRLVDVLAGRRRRKVHVGTAVAHRASRLLGRPVSRVALEVLAADSLSDGPDAAAELGIARTTLAEGLAASGLRAGR
jgi:uncharacterized protein YbjT (DUF2867 family)